MLSGEPLYELFINGETTKKMISIHEAMSMGPWDIITLQQASHDSGRPQTYIPYICELADFVRENAPDAEIYFHQTWAYETDSDHGGFLHYDRSQKEMFRRISDDSEMASSLIGAKLIPAGAFIQKIRENIPEFDYEKTGLSLCRDGFHLSFEYGCLAASLVWAKAFFKKKPSIDSLPIHSGADRDLIAKIIDLL
jgi:hypothetical protein